MLGADYNINLSTSLFMIGKSPTPGSQGSALMYKHADHLHIHTCTQRVLVIFTYTYLFVCLLMFCFCFWFFLGGGFRYYIVFSCYWYISFPLTTDELKNIPRKISNISLIILLNAVILFTETNYAYRKILS